MLRSRKRLLLLFGALILLVLVASGLYMTGMHYLEEDDRTFWESLSWASETLSTTGYGADARWQHPAMVLFVVALQFSGVFLIFLIFPVYLIPFLEERFETRLPTASPGMRDHVIILRSSPAVARLIETLKESGVESLIVEADSREARRLSEKARNVVHGTLDDGVLERVDLLRARALVANSSDVENAAATLGVRQMGFDGDVLALVEEPFHCPPMLLAGATEAYLPKSMLGAALATRASRKVNPSVAGMRDLGARLKVSEVRILEGSELAGRSLAEVNLGRRTNVTVIGQWDKGHLRAPVPPTARLKRDTTLVVVGTECALSKLSGLCGGTHVFPSHGPFIIAGYGEVGREVAKYLREAGEELIVVDRQAGEGVDLVGEVLEPGTLTRAGVDRAQAIVLALDTDSATLFATVILDDIAPRIPIFARVNRAENVERIHGAGAEFALALSEVSSHIVARRLLGETSVSLDPQLEILQVGAGKLAHRHPAGLQIRETTGCSVVAVERGEQLFTRFDEDFLISDTDLVYVCGSREAIRGFKKRYA